MGPQSTESKLVEECADYLKTRFAEELLEHEVVDNRVEDGDGELVLDCTVRLGAGTHNWRKRFSFVSGQVVDVATRPLRQSE